MVETIKSCKGRQITHISVCRMDNSVVRPTNLGGHSTKSARQDQKPDCDSDTSLIWRRPDDAVVDTPTLTSDFDSAKPANLIVLLAVQERKLKLASINPLTSVRWRSGFVLKMVAHTRLPSVGFRNWSRFLAVNLQVTWVINPAVGCHYFPPGLQLPSQPLRGLLPILLLGKQRHDGCEQFA